MRCLVPFIHNAVPEPVWDNPPPPFADTQPHYQSSFHSAAPAYNGSLQFTRRRPLGATNPTRRVVENRKIPGVARSRTGMLHAAPSGKRRDFIIMEESLPAKCEVSRQVYPSGTKGIGGNYVGKCLRLKKREWKSRGRASYAGLFNPDACRGELYKYEDKIATSRELKSHS